jgi:hypothetical protein
VDVTTSRVHLFVFFVFGHLISALLISVFALFMSGCSQPAAKVEKRESGGWIDTTFELVSSSGSRDGYLTEARFVFANGDGRELQLNLVVEVDPRATLQGGTWTFDGDSGSVRALSVKFLGGQGASPSVGGRFLLLEGAEEKYRVTIAPTTLRSTPGAQLGD